MSYIGSTPTTQSFIAGTDYFNGTGSAVNFTLSRSVNSVNDIEVIVNNVEQIPSGYSVSGTTLTFSAAPSAGTSNVYVRYLSTTLQTIGVSAGSTQSINITGNAANVTGTVAVANGGTGATTLTANSVILGNNGSAVQLVAPSTSGNVLTSNGTTWTSAAVSGFPAGTAMMFVQTAAPTGWTKSTTHDNKALRVVSGTASSGGSSTFSTVFSNQTPTITTSGLSAGATTLSTAQIPSHTHPTATGCGANGFGPQGDSSPGANTGAAGGGGSHSHSISGSATSSAITLAVQYVDVIIATKS